MKKFICIILALVCLTALVSCSKNQETPEGYKLISDENAAYYFYAPTQWVVNDGDGPDSVFYSEADRSIVTVTTYLALETIQTVEEYWKHVENSYKTTYAEYVLVESGDTMMGERNAKSYTFTATIGGVSYKLRQIIAVSGDYFYIMTYMSTPDNFDKHIEEVNGMVGVFAFKK